MLGEFLEDLISRLEGFFELTRLVHCQDILEQRRLLGRQRTFGSNTGDLGHY